MNYSRFGRFVLLVIFLLMVELIANVNSLIDVGSSIYNIRDEFIYKIFESDFEKRTQTISSALVGVFSCALFSFFESSEIIRDRNIDMEHIIARYPVRRRFLSSRVRRTVMETFIYMLMSTGLYFVLAARSSADGVESADVLFCAGFLLFFTLFCEFHILLMNLLRIYLSQDKIILTGFLCYAVEAAAACCNFRWINYLNPFYYILIHWDLSTAEKLAGLIWLLFLNLTVVVLVRRTVSKIDIGIRSENL